MKQDNKDILEQKDKGISKSRGVLSKLFRTILYDIGISGPEWENLMQRVLDDPRGPAPRNSKDRSSLKGNLNKALKGPRMSWKTFQKALRLLAPVSARLEIHLTWQKGVVTVHHVTQPIGGFQADDYVEDGKKAVKGPRPQPPASIRLHAQQLKEAAADSQTQDPHRDIAAAFAEIEHMYRGKTRAQPNERRPPIRLRASTHEINK